MLLVVVSKGVLVEVRCILYGTDESKLLKEKEDYVILDLAHYHTCKPTGFWNTVGRQLTSKKETKLYGK